MSTASRQQRSPLGALEKVTSIALPEVEKEPEFQSGKQSDIVVIERRALLRDCIARSLAVASNLVVLGVPTIKDWQELSNKEKASIVVVCKIGRQLDPETKEEIAAICLPPGPPTVIVLSDNEESNHIVEALDQGARGYLPMNMSVDVAIEAIRLVRAGGTFVPASSLIAAHRRVECSASKDDRSSDGMFSTRQNAVVEALRRGKSNKQIAYELTMCESTVKVHVRNIMKKLHAKNRTQVAFMANDRIRKQDELSQH